MLFYNENKTAFNLKKLDQQTTFNPKKTSWPVRNIAHLRVRLQFSIALLNCHYLHTVTHHSWNFHACNLFPGSIKNFIQLPDYNAVNVKK